MRLSDITRESHAALSEEGHRVRGGRGGEVQQHRTVQRALRLGLRHPRLQKVLAHRLRQAVPRFQKALLQSCDCATGCLIHTRLLLNEFRFPAELSLRSHAFSLLL